MATYKHLVQVHPVALCYEPIIAKSKGGYEFEYRQDAEDYVFLFNQTSDKTHMKAVYRGRVNDATGELERELELELEND